MLPVDPWNSSKVELPLFISPVPGLTAAWRSLVLRHFLPYCLKAGSLRKILSGFHVWVLYWADPLQVFQAFWCFCKIWPFATTFGHSIEYVHKVWGGLLFWLTHVTHDPESWRASCRTRQPTRLIPWTLNLQCYLLIWHRKQWLKVRSYSVTWLFFWDLWKIGGWA